MENLKIKVSNEAESREAQELFFELGCDYKTLPKKTPIYYARYLFVSSRGVMQVGSKNESNHFNAHGYKEITLPQLRDMVILHRNNPDDATHTKDFVNYFVSSEDKIYWYGKNEWVYSGVAKIDGLIQIQKPQPKSDIGSDLISGADALKALAVGKEVQYSHEEIPVLDQWTTIRNLEEYSLDYFLKSDTKFKFRLKPRTITINGIEVPCCGKDYQYGDAMYILNSLDPTEYSMIVLDKIDEVPLYWWRTEDEIKQVVEALRQIFVRSDDAVNAVRGWK